VRPHEIVGFIGFTVVQGYALQSPESRPGIANLGVGADALLAGGRRRLELAPVGLAEPGVLALRPNHAADGGDQPPQSSPNRVVNSCLLPIYTLEKEAMQEIPAWPSELRYTGVLFCGHPPYDRRLPGHHPPPLPVLGLRAGADRQGIRLTMPFSRAGTASAARACWTLFRCFGS